MYFFFYFFKLSNNKRSFGEVLSTAEETPLPSSAVRNKAQKASDNLRSSRGLIISGTVTCFQPHGEFVISITECMDAFHVRVESVLDILSASA